MTPQRAYRLVRTALNQGRLVRPKTCEQCGSTPTRATDGRSRIHAHHKDYSKPLDVEWLCAKCHRAETPFPENPGGPSFGESNGQARLTASAALEIRGSALGNLALAQRYGVDRRTILRVRRGETWTKLTAAQQEKE